jgi:hypothetical protein
VARVHVCLGLWRAHLERAERDGRIPEARGQLARRWQTGGAHTTSSMKDDIQLNGNGYMHAGAARECTAECARQMQRRLLPHPELDEDAMGDEKQLQGEGWARADGHMRAALTSMTEVSLRKRR